MANKNVILQDGSDNLRPQTSWDNITDKPSGKVVVEGTTLVFQSDKVVYLPDEECIILG